MNFCNTIHTDLRSFVKDTIKNETTDLNHSEAEKWLVDLQQHGCISGMIGQLIYYSDTVKFFDTFEKEIVDLAEEYEFYPNTVELGLTGFKNQMAWFAFETLAPYLFEEISFPNNP